MGRKPEWRIEAIVQDRIYLVDCGPLSRSVAVDVEHVVADLFSRYGRRRFVYRNSMMGWEELAHADGVFSGFLPWHGWTPPPP